MVRIDEKLAKQLKAFNRELNAKTNHKFSFNDASRIYADTVGAGGVILERPRKKRASPRSSPAFIKL